MLACQISALMLNIGGLAVNVQGTEILSNNSIVGIDPPCSGIKMLWVALYLSATCASLRGLKTASTLRLLALSMLAAIVANALRISSLFYVESGIIPVSGVWHTVVHSGVGVAIFALSAAALVKVAYMLPTQSKSQKPLAAAGAIANTQLPPTTASKPSNASNAEAFKHTPFAFGCVVALFLIAASLPLVVNRASAEVTAVNFAGWPTQFEGQHLEPIKPST